jgi:hypothetical protein
MIVTLELLEQMNIASAFLYSTTIKGKFWLDLLSNAVKALSSGPPAMCRFNSLIESRNSCGFVKLSQLNWSAKL